MAQEGLSTFANGKPAWNSTPHISTCQVPLPLTWHLHRAQVPLVCDPIINELQQMRGRVLYADGRRPSFRCSDGRFSDPCPLDPFCHHVLVRADSEIIGCCRLLTPSRIAATGIESELGTELYEQVLKEVGASREELGEAGRWIVAPEYAGLSLGLRLIAGVWAIARTTTIPVFIAMAGTRSAQAAALIRTGARPLATLAPILSQKYDDELQLLFFETAKPAFRFKSLIEKMSVALELGT